MNNMIPAVDKTVQILHLLAETEATQAELRRRLDIAMSTVYRILVTLCAHDWVRKKPDGRYVLAAGILPLTQGLARDLDILEKAKRQVNFIAEKYQIACKFSLRNGEEQLTSSRAEPPGPVALTGQAGSTFPLIEGSVGAALLCKEAPEKIRELAKHCQADIPEKRDPELILARIREIQDRGAILNQTKNRWNIAAFSIPLRRSSGQVAGALTLIGAKGDFAGKKRIKWEQILKTAAAECEK